jgi:hypothetical protein
MTLQRAALLTAGSLAALGLSTALAHADDTVDLFSGDNIAITAPDGLTGAGVAVGGLPPVDTAYEYASQTVDINGLPDADKADVYLVNDVLGGTEKLVDLTPGEPIANSDIFDTFSIADGAVILEHADVADSLDGLATGNYDAVVLDGTTFALPEAVSNALGADFGLTALDVTILSQQASDAATALDVAPFIDVLTSLF